MKIWCAVAALAYLSLAVAHSYLGERKVLVPLLAQAWAIALPRSFAQPLLRWAWHLTSVIWLSAAAILAMAATRGGIPPVALDALGVAALASGAVMLVALRGVHPAWAVFAVAAIGCFAGAHGWPRGELVKLTAGAASALTLGGLAALHLYWAGGRRWGLAAAIPTKPDGAPTFRPGAAATVVVALALAAAAAIVGSAAGLLPALPGAEPLGLAAAVVFTARMIGDFRFAGLFKRERLTAFARWDSQLFSPLCGALALACALAAG